MNEKFPGTKDKKNQEDAKAFGRLLANEILSNPNDSGLMSIVAKIGLEEFDTHTFDIEMRKIASLADRGNGFKAKPK